jgi:hypothetical protein
MRPAPADHRLTFGRLTFGPLGVAAIVFAGAACGGSTPSIMDAGVDAASDGREEAAPQTSDDGAAIDSGANCDPTGATLAPTNDPACPPRGMNPAAGSACSVEALRCTYYGYGGDCLPGVPYVLTCCDGKWRFGISCPDASAD